MRKTCFNFTEKNMEYDRHTCTSLEKSLKVLPYV